ncbi:MAG: DUF1028 domain-containing protein [Paracoccus sp. (in: a-proteobacteria)]|uniref:DUF1028 domain-containing protein n=1 Tax=Paracoccus sp. TaxID=267 RepID=UPI0026E02C1F|nr:DUF1028 domain-containing protein [Paracoccus sp. (in: a-proteobacteria)]MDO5621376.1 DUF1028 domain-containing protein [Paracoccus sp. (in: a-proteobacteria)]
MTYSIVARCPRTAQLGVAIATAVPAVGALAPFASSKGAIASQAFVNPYLGLDGLHLLDQGQDAQTALDALIAADPGRDTRQLAIIDAQGRVAQFSGVACNGWFGQKAGASFGCQGNLLTGPEVVDAMAVAMEASVAEPLEERLIAALVAGQAAGGDRRGRSFSPLLGRCRRGITR